MIYSYNKKNLFRKNYGDFVRQNFYLVRLYFGACNQTKMIINKISLYSKLLVYTIYIVYIIYTSIYIYIYIYIYIHTYRINI